MTTIQAIFDRVVEKYGLGKVIANGDIDALVAGSFTSVKWLRNGNWGTNQFRSKSSLIQRPGAATAADEIRYAADLTNSSGLMAVDANWADTTLGTEYLRILDYGLHPQEVYDAIERGLRRIHFQNQVYASLAADADMQSSATTSWTESDADAGPATTFTKETTASFIASGVRAGKIVNGAAGGYIRQRFSVIEGERIYAAAPILWASGTAAGLALRDVTNSAAIGTATSSAHLPYMFHERLETVPSDCKQVEVRLIGEGTDTFYVDGLHFQRESQSRLFLPSTINEAFEFEALTFARYPKNIDTNLYDAASIQVEEIPRSEFSANFLPPEANPSFIQFHNWGKWFGKPLILQGRRPYADLLADATDETETVAADLELACAAAALELFEMLGHRLPQGREWAARAELDYKAHGARQTVEGPARRQPEYVMPRFSN